MQTTSTIDHSFEWIFNKIPTCQSSARKFDRYVLAYAHLTELFLYTVFKIGEEALSALTKIPFTVVQIPFEEVTHHLNRCKQYAIALSYFPKIIADPSTAAKRFIECGMLEANPLNADKAPSKLWTYRKAILGTMTFLIGAIATHRLNLLNRLINGLTLTFSNHSGFNAIDVCNLNVTNSTSLFNNTFNQIVENRPYHSWLPYLSLLITALGATSLVLALGVSVIKRLDQLPAEDSAVEEADELTQPLQENLKLAIDELNQNDLHIEIQNGTPIILKGKKTGSEEVLTSLNRTQIYPLIELAYSEKEQLPGLINYLMQLKSTPTPFRLTPTILLSIIKIFGLNSGVKRFLLSQQQFENYPIVFNPYSKEDVNLYRELTKYGYSIDAAFFSNVLLIQDYPFIKAVLEQESDGWWKINATSILKALMKTEDPQTAELIMQRFPTMGSECPVDLLVEALSLGKQDFVHWLLISGFRLPKNRMKDLIKLAVKTKNLRLIRELCTYAKNQRIHCPSYPEILGLGALELTQATDMEKTLFGYALFSPLEEIYALVKQYPFFSSTLPTVLRKISLVVRFPSIEQAQEVHKEFSDREAYIASSLAYAEENLTFLKKESQTLSVPTRPQLLDAIIADRYKRMSIKNKDFITKQIDKPNDEATTSLTRGDGLLKGVGGRAYLTKMNTNRYHWSVRHFAARCYDAQENQRKASKAWQHQYSAWTYSYTIPGTDEAIPINTYMKHRNPAVGSYWHHPDGQTIARLQKHVNGLHDEIIQYKLNLNNIENKKVFFEKVARCYFLQAVLCETYRGTPHNVMMWLNYVYDHHGLPPPIPNRDNFFLDNTMLMSGVDEAIEGWHTRLEPTLDDSLSASSSSSSSSSTTSSPGNLTLEQATRLAKLEEESGCVRFTREELDELATLRTLRDTRDIYK